MYIVGESFAVDGALYDLDAVFICFSGGSGLADGLKDCFICLSHSLLVGQI